MLHLFDGLEFHTSMMLLIALIFVLIYEFINGFHDTSNAVATIVYTRALRSQFAVIMSGVFNLLGVLMGGLSVAYAIVHLFPTHFLLNITSTSYGLSMMFSMLLAAILWNIGTWYLGLPASSSHTLIGALIGTSLTHAAAVSNDSSIIEALNIPKLIEIIFSLFVSPLVGLLLASLMIFFLRRFRNHSKRYWGLLHLTPEEREEKYGENNPPFWPRVALILSSASVSFSHGANDGQKGIGLIMLVLMSIAPSGFIVNMNASRHDIVRTYDAVNHLQKYYIQYQQKSTFSNMVPFSNSNNATTENHLILEKVKKKHTQEEYSDLSQIIIAINHLLLLLGKLDSYNQLNLDQRLHVRYLLMCIAESTDRIEQLQKTSISDKRFLNHLRQDLLNTIEYAPLWIVFAIALALSLGTMVGWRRVVMTIGGKIGKKGMTYAQGLSAQMTAAISIGVASYTGMPVSTTHVLSSAVTGTMLVDGGGIQGETVKNILIAWILTVPVSIGLSGGLYWIFLKIL